MLSAPDDPDARRRDEPRISIESLLAGRKYHRGYLTATSLEHETFGLTSLDDRPLLLDLLMELRQGRPFFAYRAEHDHPTRDPEILFDDAASILVVIFGDLALDASTLHALAADRRRPAVGYIRTILDSGVPVLFPEPAHHGSDWTIFSPFPLSGHIATALARHASPRRRCFVIPYQEARSEEKFYFERYDIDRFTEHEVGQ